MRKRLVNPRSCESPCIYNAYIYNFCKHQEILHAGFETTFVRYSEWRGNSGTKILRGLCPNARWRACLHPSETKLFMRPLVDRLI